MSTLTIINYDSDAIQSAMAVALLQHKNALGLTYREIGRVIGREAPSVHQYVCDTTEMPATCWLRLVAKWPELEDRLIFNLDEAEKAFRARQRALPFSQPQQEDA